MDRLLPAAGIVCIGKEVFHIVGFSTGGKVASRRRIMRLSRQPVITAWTQGERLGYLDGRPWSGHRNVRSLSPSSGATPPLIGDLQQSFGA